MKKLLLFIFLTITSCVSFSQTKKLDSLWAVYNNKTQADTNRLKAIDAIAWRYTSNKPDTSIILAQQQLQLAKQNKLKKYEGWAFNLMGASYKSTGNYPKALDCYLKGLKIAEEVGDKTGVGNCSNNIGSIYSNQGNRPKALEYYLKALNLFTEINSKHNMGNCLSNIGIEYSQQLNNSKTLEFYFKALKLRQEIEDKEGLSASYSNIGTFYDDHGDYPKALEYYLKAIEICKETGAKQQTAICYLNMGILYIKLSDLKLSIKYLNSCLKICEETGDIDVERFAFENLAIIYAYTHNYKEAYNTHVKFKQLTDSIFNAENSKQLGDMKTQFEVDKKEAELKIKAEAQQAISLEEKKRQQFVIYSVAGVLILVIVFSLFLYKRFRITNKQKKVIEEQKILVDDAYEKLHEKNKEVMDSINYAKRIQTALITSEKYIERNLKKLQKD
jgi:tetratricopeptide (TPR) repeat protein